MKKNHRRQSCRHTPIPTSGRPTRRRSKSRSPAVTITAREDDPQATARSSLLPPICLEKVMEDLDKMTASAAPWVHECEGGRGSSPTRCVQVFYCWYRVEMDHGSMARVIQQF